MENRAVTTCNIDHMHFTEEGRNDERDAEEGTSHAHQVECKGSGDPRIAMRIAADIEELGCRSDEWSGKQVRSGRAETKSASAYERPRGESQSKGGSTRTLKDVLEKRLNTKGKSMVEWSAGLIIRYAKGLSDRTAYKETRGRDAANTSGRVWKEDHVHDVREHEPERAEGRCEVP